MADKSIHPNSRKEKTRLRRKANHIKNAAIRAALYAEHKGNLNWNREVSTWHSGIEALRMGTA